MIEFALAGPSNLIAVNKDVILLPIVNMYGPFYSLWKVGGGEIVKKNGKFDLG